jgi:hypothetical protein
LDESALGLELILADRHTNRGHSEAAHAQERYCDTRAALAILAAVEREATIANDLERTLEVRATGSRTDTHADIDQFFAAVITSNQAPDAGYRCTYTPEYIDKPDGELVEDQYFTFYGVASWQSCFNV